MSHIGQDDAAQTLYYSPTFPISATLIMSSVHVWDKVTSPHGTAYQKLNFMVLQFQKQEMFVRKMGHFIKRFCMHLISRLYP